MVNLYYFILFTFFIIISNIICKNIDKRVAANVISAIISIVFVLFSLILFSLIFMFAEVFTGPGVYVYGYTFDVLVPIIISILNIYIVSKIFKYDVKIPLWILIFTVVDALIIYPVYAVKFKRMMTALDHLFNIDTAFSFFDVFTIDTSFYDLFIIFFERLPSILLVVYLIVSKTSKNKKESV